MSILAIDTMGMPTQAISLERNHRGTVDIIIGVGSHFSASIINEAWIRLTKVQVEELIVKLGMYVRGTGFTRDIINISPSFGHNHSLSIEVSDYTDGELELIIVNSSRLFNKPINEVFIRVSREDAERIRLELLKMTDE